MWSHPKTDAAGFTLVECQIAVLMLTLVLLGFMHLNGAHERLVADMESWLADDPTYYVEKHDDELMRILGAPAWLATVPPTPLSPPPSPDAYDVYVLDATLGLRPLSASATFYQEEL